MGRFYIPLAITAALLAVLGFTAYTHMRNTSDVPAPVKSLFDQWAAQHGKSYGTSSDYQFRLGVFHSNFKFVEEASKTSSFSLGLNQFADLTESEFLVKFTGLKANNQRLLNKRSNKRYQTKTVTAPSSIDWRSKGKVNPIKDQASCGSCWAFSTVQSIESRLAIKTGTLSSLSEQQLVDCAGGKWGNHGCNGGLMDQGFKYVKHEHGLTTESDYPYTARLGKCHSVSTHLGNVVDYVDIPRSAAQHEQALAEGPISVAIAATRKMMFYKGGVFDDPHCGTGLNHGVGVVGYGHDSSLGQDFWIVRNSWGASWGESGYIRFRKDVTTYGGTCGVLLMSSYPVLG